MIELGPQQWFFTFLRCIFAYICQQDATWHATSALGTHMVRLECMIDLFKQFGEPNVHGAFRTRD